MRSNPLTVKEKARQIADSLQLQRYPYSFATARRLKRHVYFHLGPTNSGKTYEALIKLQQARSGIYLAPLRLLAMEIRDRMMQAGIPCNLVTGEERQLVAGALHTACTVEMMNPDMEVEVAIIDEIQMLQDEQRGYAWTAALLGAPAQHVYVCGSTAVIEPCLRAIAALGETYSVHYLERKTPLLLEEQALSDRSDAHYRGRRHYQQWMLKQQLQTGDAVIAFSRKDVLTFSARFRQWGFTVATIYGALSPEVRRTESQRFNSGEAGILVATDAIGMGLNLPIRRIIFSSIYKFDGIASRTLNATEVRQIAGRAGRYGLYPVGYVNAFEGDELLHLQNMLSISDTSALDKLPIAPSIWHLREIAQTLHSARISELLAYFSEHLTVDSPYFQTADVGIQEKLGKLLDEFAPNLALDQKFILSCAPVNIDQAHERDYFLDCLQSVARQEKRSLPANRQWLTTINPKRLEEAENMSKDVSLYAWLAYKFPTIFYQHAELPDLRNRISRFIEGALLLQAGYKDTSKELMLAMDRRHR